MALLSFVHTPLLVAFLCMIIWLAVTSVIWLFCSSLLLLTMADSERPSAVREALSRVEDQLTCPFCLEPYTNPRLLACFHVYCQHCLDQIVLCNRQDKLSIICPKCRHSTPLPPSGVSGLQAAFHVNHWLDVQKAQKKIEQSQNLTCENCSVTTPQATGYCQHCTKFICEGCLTVHKEWDEFKGHEVVSIDRVKRNLKCLISPKNVTPRCTSHDKNLKLYCESCKELICRDCIVQIHKDHKYCLISDTFEAHKNELDRCVGPVEKQLEATNAALVELDSIRREIIRQQTCVKTDIHATFNQLRKTIDAREAELVSQLEGHSQQQLKCISAQIEEVKILQTQRESCVQFVKESIRSRFPGDVVKMKERVVNQVKELVNLFDPSTLDPYEQASTNYVSPAEQLESFNEISNLCLVKLPCVSKVDVKSTALAQFLFPSDIALPEAWLVSRLTNQTTRCVVKKQGEGEYKISYQPTVGGVHQLHVRVNGEEVKGSPFHVTVKTPVDKLGTVIKTINRIEKPFGVTVNRSGSVIVTEEGSGCVYIFGPKEVQTINLQGTVVGKMKDPRGVAVDHEDNILVVDAGNHRLLKFSQGGDLIASVGGKGDDPGQFMNPFGLCVNKKNGKVYVVDREAHDHCVQIFNSDLTFCSKFGCTSRDIEHGCKEHESDHPWDIASDSTGCVYVTDFNNDRVQVFTSDGGYLRQFSEKSSGSGKLKCPASIFVDSDDMVYVGELWNYCISMFTCQGKFVKSFGLKGPGRVPYGIAVDACGVVYVCDRDNNRVQVF